LWLLAAEIVQREKPSDSIGITEVPYDEVISKHGSLENHISASAKAELLTAALWP